MAASELTFEEIYDYFKQKGGTVSNSEVVRHFKPYLTHQASKGMYEKTSGVLISGEYRLFTSGSATTCGFSLNLTRLFHVIRN